MAKKNFWIGMLAAALAFGMAVVGCGNGSTDDKGGTFVLNDIPAAYNGKYACLEAGNDNFMLMGAQSINVAAETIVAVRISNGSVSLPMWRFNESTGSVSKYSGNDTFNEDADGYVGVMILESASWDYASDPLALIYFSSVTFSNGSATKSCNDGEIDED